MAMVLLWGKGAMNLLRRLRSNQRGMSATETSVFLLAASLVTSAGAPAVDDYVNLAREIKVQSDVRTIAVTLARLHAEPGGAVGARFAPTLRLLVGAGEQPATSAAESRGWGDPLERGEVERLEDYLSTGVAVASKPQERRARGWRGPYLEGPISSDPWGHRYAVNVQFLRAANGRDVVVLLAGADGIAETPFAQDGSMPNGDDRLALVSSGW